MKDDLEDQTCRLATLGDTQVEVVVSTAEAVRLRGEEGGVGAGLTLSHPGV